MLGLIMYIQAKIFDVQLDNKQTESLICQI